MSAVGTRNAKADRGADLLVRNPEDANKPHRLMLLVQDAIG
ncbi:hypothetical protein [Thiocapsa sp.]